MEYDKPVLERLGDSPDAFRSELRRSCKDSSSASIRLDISFTRERNRDQAVYKCEKYKYFFLKLLATCL